MGSATVSLHLHQAGKCLSEVGAGMHRQLGAMALPRCLIATKRNQRAIGTVAPHASH